MNSFGFPLMQCGHVAQGRFQTSKKPVCLFCLNLTEKAKLEAPDPDLVGRTAECTSCHLLATSHLDLPAFEYHPGDEHDLYYCSCDGGLKR